MPDTRDAGPRTDQARRALSGSFLGALERHAADLGQGRTPAQAAAALATSWNEALEAAWRASYAAGRGVHGARPLADLPAGTERALRRQKQWAFRFAMDVARGVPEEKGRLNAASRAGLYQGAVEAAYQMGAMDGAPEGQLIYWRLNDAEHCVECPTLAANSPYTHETLPAVPRGGSTPCGTHCRCYLTFRDSTRTKTPKPQGPDERWAQRSLKEKVEGPLPTPPPGKRLPDEAERLHLKDLELRANFAARRAQRLGDKDDESGRDLWLGRLRDLRRLQIEFQREKGIWAPPTFSQSEVLTSVDVRAGDVDWLTHLRGIDGTTVHRAQAAAVSEALAAAQRDFDLLAARVAAEEGQAVPALGQLLDEAARPVSAPGNSIREAAVVDPPTLADWTVVQAVGLGLAATGRLAIEVVRELASKPYEVDVGPFEGDWPALVAELGIWIEGPGEQVSALVAAAGRRAGGRGVEVAEWVSPS